MKNLFPSLRSFFRKSLNWFLIIEMACSHFSCKKWVQVPVPDSRLSTGSVFANDGTAESAIAGVYSSFWDKGFYISLLPGLSADEFKDYSLFASRSELNQNSILASNQDVNSLWNYFYTNIYQCNSVIYGLTNHEGVSTPVKTQLIAEALTWRAFCYYYLVNLWGPVPLILTTDYTRNSNASRISVDSIRAQMVRDLHDAAPGLPTNYSNSERTRITLWANLAIQARIYASLKNWPEVETYTTEIINQTLFSLPGDLDSVFLKNSQESIWQLEPLGPGESTYEGSQFILEGTPNVAAIDDKLLQAFEPGDLRKTMWIGIETVNGIDYAYPFKYKDKTVENPLREYAMVLRLAEQYLLRAESRANQNNLSGGLEDINALRERANLPDETASNQAELLNEITQERRVELFSEWGERWLYLKRIGQADAVFSGEKAGWRSTDALYPIPQTEISNDPKLIQNPGY